MGFLCEVGGRYEVGGLFDVGRTGRAGRPGKAITFFTDTDAVNLRW